MPRPLLGLALLLLVSGCSLFDSSTDDELADARARWARAGVADYAFTLTVGCFCGHAGQYAINVQEDEVAAIERMDGTPIPETVLDLVRLTTDDLFEVVESALDGGADEILVEYDLELGYPLSIRIDYIREAVDDEVSYNVSAFTAVE